MPDTIADIAVARLAEGAEPMIGPCRADTLSIPTLALDTAADYSFSGIAITVPAECEFTEIPWLSGIEPEPMPANHSGFIMTMSIMAVLLLANFKSFSAALKFNLDELFNVRRGRDNVFDDRPAAVWPVQAVLIGLLIACGGYILAASFCDGLPSSLSVVLGAALTLGYYATLHAAYSAVGFTFTTNEGRREWVRGYSASMSFLAISLVVPALCALFYPAWIGAIAAVSVALFFLAKLIFVVKGFRIFYDNLLSLLYFILYLCTLEIIPIILVYNCSAMMLNNA